MTQANHQKADLLTEAKIELGSLMKLIAQFFLGALELFISINTVKKHMKNIRTKQQMALLQRMALLRQ